MSNKQPVVLYGASGYTGRLVAEFLRDQQIPFIAAGRSKERIEKAMSIVPGIETADYEIAEVEHNVDALSELFSGAQVVCNTVGPFLKYGPETVEACLNAGVHYIDTTGEQAWILRVREEFGARFAEEGLLVAPAVAYMFVPCEIVGSICREQSGIDSLDFTCIPSAIPTEGSTQSFYNMVDTKAYYLNQGQLVEWPRAQGYEMVSPAFSHTILGLPWGGSAMPIWYQGDSKINNVKALTGFTDRGLMQGVLGMMQHYEDNLKDLPGAERSQIISDMANQVQPGMPPRENQLIHRCVDRCIGTGGLNRVAATLYSTRAYQQTGLVQAVAARQLIDGNIKATGFQSGCAAFGYEIFLSQLESYGYARLSVELD